MSIRAYRVFMGVKMARPYVATYYNFSPTPEPSYGRHDKYWDILL